MHSINLIHGDIKPENIIQCKAKDQYCSRPQCKHKFHRYCLIDFGTCRFLKEGPTQKTKTQFFGTRKFAGK